MGNLCGKQSKDDNFQGPGRTLGSAPPPSNNAKASIPANVKTGGSAKPAPKVGGPPRALGGTGDTSGSAQSAAAAAAEARNNKPPTGDLAKKLAEQKKQTHNQALQAAAAENRAQREADAVTEARNYN